MNCSLCDAVFTGRSFGGRATSLVQEWKVYYSIVFWHRWRWCQGFCPISHLGCGRFLEPSLMGWVIMGLGCVFHSGTSETTWHQEDTIALWQFNVRVSWLKIVDKAAWNFKFQKSCFCLSENLFIYLFIYCSIIEHSL